MKVKVGDKVLVITGSDKGKEGKVIRTYKNEDKVVVEGINLRKKHVKPNGAGEGGGIIDREGNIHVSNVKVITNTKKENKAKKETKKEEVKETSKKQTKKASKEA